MKLITFTLTCTLLFYCVYGQNKTLTNGRPVNEKFFLSLGGAKQYVEITGTSDTKPVLLFIHGGPGWPQIPQLRYLNADLTKSYILVAWDQRGCGKSYMADSAAENVTLKQIVADAHELTQFLRTKYNKKKIYLAGFSWGSIVGITLAQQYPQDYIAYIGISQVININAGMKVTRQWISKQATQQHDTATLQTLSRLDRGDTGLCNGGLSCFMAQYELLSKYHGAVFNPASEKIVEKAMSNYDDYKTYDWNKGFFYSASRLEKDMFTADFSTLTKLSIPVYFIAGRHDWNVPAVLVNKLFIQLKAPKKKLFWFEQSGHGPLEEEPAKFNQVLAAIAQ